MCWNYTYIWIADAVTILHKTILFIILLIDHSLQATYYMYIIVQTFKPIILNNLLP